MKHYGIQVAEGTTITNISIPSGTAFPVGPTNPPNDGELFYITGGANPIGLYVYKASNTNWNRLALFSEITGGSGGTTWSVKTANYTASNGEGVVADTSGGTFTVTLPATPSTGDKVEVIYEPGSSSNLLTIGRNGEKIMGLAEDMTVATADVALSFIYINATYGWRIA